ncbi:hypothetical protein SR870_16595 [Rhodopseudomonas palustris]|uniref:hypothetical protein n=1 Tax=Rhodopseudomonas palustris TaxID=1076 RepID=UPI002ACD5E5B|nr:hypothetical protein [Rhodopseudomonas palustris]WQH02173.1 hypothetical protein SR870_16595 [Rhodopseudomonas palustris]
MMAPRHHWPLDLKSPRIPLPVDQKQREIKPLEGCQTQFKKKAADPPVLYNRFFSMRALALS